MAPIPPSAFEREVADLAPEARARFVADVYAARGVPAHVDGARVTFTDGSTGVSNGSRERRSHHDGQSVIEATVDTDDGDRTDRHTLWVARTGLLGRPKRVPEDVDAVVTAGVSRPPPVPDGVATVDAENLRTTLLYGIERTAASELFDRHLGCTPTGWDVGPEHRTGARPAAQGAASESEATSAANRRQPDDGTERGRHGVAAVAVLALVVALVVAPASPFAVVTGDRGDTATGVDATTASGSETGSTGEVGGVGATGGGAAGDGTDDDDDDGAQLVLAPGVTVRGVERSSLLARAHARQVANRSYVLRVSASEYAGQLQMAYRSAEVRMRDPSRPVRYRTDVVKWGEFRTQPGPIPSESVYGNGAVELVRSENGTAEPRPVRSDAAAGPEYPYWATTLVYWYLSVRNTTIREEWTDDGTTYYEIVGSDYPFPGVENASTRAIVDGDGVVHALEHYHDVPDANRRLYVSMRYEFTEPRVVAPQWVNESTVVASLNASRAMATGNRTAAGTADRETGHVATPRPP
jgi:hypothetical protein